MSAAEHHRSRTRSVVWSARMKRLSMSVGILMAVLAVAGCGGGARVTGADKDKISHAALGISVACISGGKDADVSDVENGVTELLNARDKFGDQRFTISKEVSDVTVQDIIDRQAKLMADNDCAPDQAKRLH